MYHKYADLRDKAGLTDYEVSKQTGVSTATLTNWKYGRYTPKADKLLPISKLLGIPIETLLQDNTKT